MRKTKTRTKTKNRHPLIRIIDEVVRLKGRLQSVFVGARTATGLSTMETMVLTAVVESKSPPTVSQIGRSLGHPRQVVQRAANRLLEVRLLEAGANPAHRRAQLLHATTAGKKLYAEAQAIARESADSLTRIIGRGECERLANDLQALRTKLEAHVRSDRQRARKAR
jgi:DNA-binding MarR family transcriptional regulator